MSLLARTGHLVGLAAAIAITVILYHWWPWPFEALRISAPDFYKEQVRPWFNDYMRFAGFLVAILILSLLNGLWTFVANHIAKKDGS